jgi:Arm DNA-binding domain
VPDQRCKGLVVRVAQSCVKTRDLAYRIRWTGKMRRLSLGRTTDVSLEQARERANKLTTAARGGRDLICEEEEAKDAVASRISVAKLIDLYLRRRVSGRLRTAKTIASRLRRTLAPVGQRYAADIWRRDLGALLDRIADRGQDGKLKNAGRFARQYFAGRYRRTSLRRTPLPVLRRMIAARRAIGS